MAEFPIDTAVPVRRASQVELAEIERFQNAVWPANLFRFALFRWTADSKTRLFRAVTWDPLTRHLYTQEIELDTTLESSRWPKPVHIPDGAIFQSEITVVSECVRPAFMQAPLEQMEASLLKGLHYRNMLAYSLLMLDKHGQHDSQRFIDPQGFIFNDLVVISKDARRAATSHIIQSLGRKETYRPYILTIASTFIWFGGGPAALIRLSPKQGGKGDSRVGKNRKKPGRLSNAETRRRDRAAFSGKAEFERQTPVRRSDIKKFVAALTVYWAKGKQTIAETYRKMVCDSYRKSAVRLCPTLRMFSYHAPKLIKEHDLKSIRLGHKLAAQHNDARTGQASDITHGVIDILDVDGMQAKTYIAAVIAGKVEPVPVWIIFGVSRLSGAILGYEIALEGEKNSAYRTCIASGFWSKQERATQLGLDKLPGLLHGNIDGIFVDNGPGASEPVSQTAIDEMGLIRALPPGGRGDLKAVGEGINGIMIKLMANKGVGYTREYDVIEKEIRRIFRQSEPIPLDDFERFLLKAISAYNLYTNKRRLRTKAMRDAGVGITPKAIFTYTQKLRTGEAARAYSTAEVIGKFIPWVPKVCRKGLVLLADARFTSQSMEDFFNSHTAGYVGKAPNPTVEVKQVPGTIFHIQWRAPSGAVEILNMVEEDRRRFGNISWNGFRLARLDENIQDEKLKNKATRQTNTLAVNQQEKINAAERGRGNPIGSLAGSCTKEARRNAAHRRDSELSQLLVAKLEVQSKDAVTSEASTFPERTKAEQLEADFYASLGLD